MIRQVAFILAKLTEYQETTHAIFATDNFFGTLNTDPALQFSFGSCVCPPICLSKDKFQRASLHDTSYESHLQVVDTRQRSSPVS